MTRKIPLIIILILFIFGCYEVFFGKSETIRKSTPSFSELSASSKKLETEATRLEKYCTSDFETKKASLEKTIKEYEEAKKEYDNLLSTTEAGESILSSEVNNLKDIYDVDFLWTIVGNYATEEGINLKFDISKNTTSASSINNKSNDYVVCDLKFTITGKYINLTDFIYDIEDDDRLNFEINNFEMVPTDYSDLQVTLTVKEIKVNSKNLIENNILSSFDENLSSEDNTKKDAGKTTENATKNEETGVNSSKENKKVQTDVN